MIDINLKSNDSRRSNCREPKVFLNLQPITTLFLLNSYSVSFVPYTLFFCLLIRLFFKTYLHVPTVLLIQPVCDCVHVLDRIFEYITVYTAKYCTYSLLVQTVKYYDQIYFTVSLYCAVFSTQYVPVCVFTRY